MEIIMEFIVANYLIFILVGLAIIFAIIGYVSDKKQQAKKKDSEGETKEDKIKEFVDQNKKTEAEEKAKKEEKKALKEQEDITLDSEADDLLNEDAVEIEKTMDDEFEVDPELTVPFGDTEVLSKKGKKKNNKVVDFLADEVPDKEFLDKLSEEKRNDDKNKDKDDIIKL